MAKKRSTNSKRLKRRKSPLKRKKVLKRRPFLIFILVGLAILSLLIYLFKDLPSPKKLTSNQFPVSTLIYDRHNQLLYEIYAEQNRNPIKLQDLPPVIKQATIAIEDKDFYKHGPFDLKGIIRASINIVFKQKLQGGSTITQQLVKTALLSPERTLRRKIREAFLAMLTEFLYSKDQILELYLNHIPYGGTAYGIEQAAQKYFNKHAQELNLAEAALLAGLPAAPTKYSPFGSNPEMAKKRQKLVLQRMVEDGYINQAEADTAFTSELKYAPQQTNIRAPHFVMYVKDLLVEKYGEKIVEQGGLRVKTTLDLELQNFAQEAVTSQISKLKNYQVTNGAALITKPKTGEILAMVGSKDYFDQEIDGNVNLTVSLRQPGSAIKPINYALGLLNGYTAADMFLDYPTCFSIPGQPLYCPKNYDGKFHGPVQMRFALGNSYNIPAVKMLALNGINSLIATASAMGITNWKDPSNYGLSLTLGGGEVTMLEMATAFGVFANAGRKIELTPFLEIKDYQENLLEKYEPEKSPPVGQKVLPEAVTYIISHMLLDNNARSAVFGNNSQLVIPNHAVSVKTGTTDDLRDNWTIGFTPSYLTAVWVGNNDNSPMNPALVSGVTGAAPIWNQIMKFVLKDKPDEWPKKPEEVEGREVCTLITNLETENKSENCKPRFEYFIKGTNFHQKIERKKILIDKNTGWPPQEGITANLEEQEHLVGSDVLTTDYCLDCPAENVKTIIINMAKINQSQP